MTTLTFVEGAVPLAKTISPTSTAGYPLIRSLTSHTVNVTDIQSFFQELMLAASKGWALMKGPLRKQLFNESRANHSDNNMPSDMLCLDFDDLQVPDMQVILQELNLHQHQHIVQYSASHKVKKGICAHVFFRMSPMPAAELKRWLQFQNLSCPTLKKLLLPNKTNTALKYPLDIVTADNSRILFIAPPSFIDGAVDPMANIPRITVVDRDTNGKLLKELVTLSTPPDAISLRSLLDCELDQLIPPAMRSNGRLYHSNTSYAEDILESPIHAQVTGVKDNPNSDFVYLNLNGGDSWGYYYVRNSPEVLLNFKGEPPYLTQSIIPQHFQSNGAHEGTGAYIELDSEAFVIVADNEVHIKAKWEAVISYLKTKELPPINRDTLTTIHVTYDPRIPYGFSPATVPTNRFRKVPQFNLCQLPVIPRINQPFPSIEAIIKHICVDATTYERLIQWVASVIQTKRPNRTAWIFTGVPGTGKGLFTETILKALVGHKNVRTITTDDLESGYNGYAANNMFLIYDEAQWESMRMKSIDHALKTIVTSEELSINEKYLRSKPTPNFNNLIICSNEHEPIRISHDDRRYNIAPRQEVSLLKRYGATALKNMVDSIYTEIPNFYDALMSEHLRPELIHQIAHTDARANLIAHNEWDMMTVSRALKTGNLLFFAQACIAPDMSSTTGIMQSKYNELVLRFIKEGMTTVTIPEMKLLYKIHCAKVQDSYTNFKKQLLRSGLNLDETQQHQGFFVEWQPLPQTAVAKKPTPPKKAKP